MLVEQCSRMPSQARRGKGQQSSVCTVSEQLAICANEPSWPVRQSARPARQLLPKVETAAGKQQARCLILSMSLFTASASTQGATLLPTLAYIS